MNAQLASYKVLVLNATHVPINICNWKRAIKLIYKGKASVMNSNGYKINGEIDMPIVVKLINYIPMPYSEIVLTRRNVYLRDNFRCQYCGKTGQLTIDHIVPRSRGGRDVWKNVVACCMRCNNKKGDMTLQEAGLKLRGTPYKPPSMLYLHMTRMLSVPESWSKYFFARN